MKIRSLHLRALSFLWTNFWGVGALIFLGGGMLLANVSDSPSDSREVNRIYGALGAPFICIGYAFFVLACMFNNEAGELLFESPNPDY